VHADFKILTKTTLIQKLRNEQPGYESRRAEFVGITLFFDQLLLIIELAKEIGSLKSHKGNISYLAMPERNVQNDTRWHERTTRNTFKVDNVTTKYGV